MFKILRPQLPSHCIVISFSCITLSEMCPIKHPCKNLHWSLSVSLAYLVQTGGSGGITCQLRSSFLGQISLPVGVCMCVTDMSDVWSCGDLCFSMRHAVWYQDFGPGVPRRKQEKELEALGPCIKPWGGIVVGDARSSRLRKLLRIYYWRRQCLESGLSIQRQCKPFSARERYANGEDQDSRLSPENKLRGLLDLWSSKVVSGKGSVAFKRCDFYF